MISLIPPSVKNIWEKGNIRGVILTSLSLQIFLILFSPLRKRTSNIIFVLCLWSAYLLADAAANFCIGLISNKYEDNATSFSTLQDCLLAFWAPFLLLHLGGPDTITSFSLEDNELWPRHFLGLIFQLAATVYVFFLTLPQNTLWLPTSLIFLAGIIKYVERTRSLQLASLSVFRQSMVRKPDAGPNYARLMEEYEARREAGLPSHIVRMPEPDQANVVAVRSAHAPTSHPVEHKEERSPHEIVNDKEDDAAADHDDQSHNPTTSPPNMEKNHKAEVHDEVKELDDVEVVKKAYAFFDVFKGLIVDMIFSFQERDKSRDYFLKISSQDALRVIEVELNFMYEVFYTKVTVVRTNWGYFFRFLSMACVVASLILFIIAHKHGLSLLDIQVTYILLYGAITLDTLALSMLIFSDRTVASLNFDDENSLTLIRFFKHHLLKPILKLVLQLKKPNWGKDNNNAGNFKYQQLSGYTFSRRWCGLISGHSLISFCRNQCANDPTRIDTQGRVQKRIADKVLDYFGANDVFDRLKYVMKYPLVKEVWDFIFCELKRKSEDADDVETTQRICSCRGEWVLQEGDTDMHREDIDKLMPYVKANQVTFDESLILWHIATDLLFYTEEGGGGDHDDDDDDDKTHNKEFYMYFSKLMSEYMLYLLIVEPTMMSAVAGIGQIRFQDSCAEAMKFLSKRPGVKEEEGDDQEKGVIYKVADAIKSCRIIERIILTLLSSKATRDKMMRKEVEEEVRSRKKVMEVCTEYKPIEVKGDRSKSLLFDGCRLAKELKNLKGKKHEKWEIIGKVWVELLSYAASNCRPITHVQQLSKGGEFISFVWMLMTHLGLGKQFQIKEGHARAKLIVGGTTTGEIADT